MTLFYSQLSYSFGNEDWDTEHQALQIQPNDTILCITASGDRPFNLLVSDCRHIVSIDANPQQNYLLELKAAAMKQLNFKEYLGFLGAESCRNRMELFHQISHHMNSAASQFWLKNHRMIEKGILYQGSMEKMTHFASKVIRLFRGRKIKKLFEMNNLEEQRKFVRTQWNTKLWKKTTEFILHPRIMKYLLDDPGLHDHHGPIKPGQYIYDRMQHSLENCLANQNTVISFFLKGKVLKEAFSPYLTQQGTELIKKRLDRMSIKTANVIDYLEGQSASSFDCYSMSDIASYMNKESFVRLLRAIVKTAKPGARFCLRQFLSFHEIPRDLAHHFNRDIELERHLEKADRCFVYRFFTGTIR